MERKVETQALTEDKIPTLEERILNVRRVSTKRVGGAAYHFSALAVVGDRNGKIGIGIAKSKENMVAMKKAVNRAKRGLFVVPITDKGSIAFEVSSKYGATKLLMRPAPLGAGIIAGGSVRQILELAGIKNISAKIIGSTNKINNAYATRIALEKLIRNKRVQVKEG